MYTRQPSKFITCVLPHGTAHALTVDLKKHHSITAANINSARGIGTTTPLGKKGLGQQLEKDILTIIIPEEQAEEVFEYVYTTARIGQPHGGFMYMGKLEYSVPFVLPDLPEEQP